MTRPNAIFNPSDRTREISARLAQAFSPEESRRLFEAAQLARLERERRERRRGMCSICHKEPPRGPWDNKCAACHRAKNLRWWRRRQKRLVEERKAQRKLQRAWSKERKTMNPAYATWALPPSDD